METRYPSPNEGAAPQSTLKSVSILENITQGKMKSVKLEKVVKTGNEKNITNFGVILLDS